MTVLASNIAFFLPSNERKRENFSKNERERGREKNRKRVLVQTVTVDDDGAEWMDSSSSVFFFSLSLGFKLRE